jgi:hypothetical protein
MASVRNIKSNARSTAKSSITKLTTMATLKSVSYAIVRQLHTLPSVEALQPGDAVNIDGIDLVQDVTLLAVGGYNYVWLVKLHQGLEVSCLPHTDQT